MLTHTLPFPPPSASHLPELLNALLPHFIIFLAYRHVQASVSFCFVMEEAVPEFQQISFPVVALPATSVSFPIF